MKKFLNWIKRVFITAAALSTNENTKAKLEAATVAIDALEKDNAG